MKSDAKTTKTEFSKLIRELLWEVKQNTVTYLLTKHLTEHIVVGSKLLCGICVCVRVCVLCVWSNGFLKKVW